MESSTRSLDLSAALPTADEHVPDRLPPAIEESAASPGLRGLARRVRAVLPQGQTLPEAAWERRHRAMLWLLLAHAIVLPIYTLTRHYGIGHSLLHGAPIAVLALLGTFATTRRQRSAAVSLGLLTASALVVHSSGGVIEAHFHFFVMIVVLTLYEDWFPFLLAVAYVVLHHGAVGALDAGAVYNHAGAVHHPWKWAAIHGAFVAAAGIGCVVSWRLNEDVRAELPLAEEARRANQAKSEFLSRVSHELRTPLNAILGFAQLLEMEKLEPQQDDSVQRILKGGSHLLTLIDEVLEISAIEAGEVRISLEPVHVRCVVSEAFDLFAPLAAEREVQLEADLAAMEGRYVLADYQRLRQVLLNLLSNAIKYNRHGGRVDVSLESIRADRLRVAVADTGPGIAAEELPMLFSPFERLGAEQRGVEGTGLGLALSRGLVEAMGGTLAAESEVGVGTTFMVEMATAEPAPRIDETSHDLAGESSRNGSGHARTVLCVEDNPLNLELIEQVFARRSDYELVSAAQGNLGLELARQHRPDLVLLDVNLPDTSGQRVLQQLRLDPRTSDIPVIVLSADATRSQVDQMTALGAHAYLTKPIDVKLLLEVVDGALPAPSGELV
jgi:signal transduction histidine kinase/ActR/RegA family two-component response regulator